MSIAQTPTEDGVLHVAPDPRGGWLVEATHQSLPANNYATRQEACRQASAYVAHGWRLVIHEHPAAEQHPAAENQTRITG
jgi:hypothetical protein